MLKKLLFTLVLGIGSLYQIQAQEISSEKHKIIFQLTSGDSMTHVKFIRQLNNVIEAAPNAEIEIVTHGMGVDLLKSDSNPFEEALFHLKNKGLKFVVCENTLKQRNLTKMQFFHWVEFVPSAILELVIKQEQGWVYIKAGE
jgi:intracellular sulfur oxidation DsrE/DsrF family protein